MKTAQWKRTTAWLLTLLLACGLLLAPLGAMAAQVPEEPVTQAKLMAEKVFTSTEAGIWPDLETFTFQLAWVSYQNGPEESHDGFVQNPMPSEDTIKMLDFFLTDHPDDEQTMMETFNPITFTQMGIYTYKMWEVPDDPPVPGVEYDDDIYYFNVYVENVYDSVTGAVVMSAGRPAVTVRYITIYRNTNSTDGQGPIVGPGDNGKVELVEVDGGGAPAEAMATFTNEYTFETMDISKTVLGSLGDITKKFEMDFLLENADGTANTITYPYRVVVGADEGEEEGTIENGGSFSIKHGQTIRIYGLQKDTKVTLTETDASAATYKTEITYNHGPDNQDKTEEMEANRSAGEMPIVEGINSQAFVNRRDTTTPTGIWLNILPYALIVLVAAGAATLYIVSKRRDKRPADKEGSL